MARKNSSNIRRARTVSRPAIIEVTDGWGVNVYVNGKLSATETEDNYDAPMNDDFTYPQKPRIVSPGDTVELCKQGFAEAFGKQYTKPGIYQVVITIESQEIQ